MKKMWRCTKQNACALNRFLRIMKLSVLLMVIATLQLSAINTYSQNEKLTLKMENASLVDVIKSIESLTELNFFYQNEQVSDVTSLDVDANKQRVDILLSDILKSSELDFRIVDKHVVIFPAEERLNKGAPAQQQDEQTIRGTVTDDQDNPIPGVTVAVKETTEGTVTDQEGNFSLSVEEEAEVLVFSFVGMQTKEVPIGDKTSFEVTMSEDVQGLDEVVVVGYGEKTKASLTGAISKVEAEGLVKSKPSTTISNSLQGALPGLSVTRTSGQPGRENFDLTVRDFTSINGGNSPLVLIDGVEGSLDNLNPDDIESVNVLKDASAAIYGSRAAGGVLLVTTKSGKKGKPVFQFNAGYTIKSPQDTWNQPSVLQYAQLHREAEMNEGRPTPWWFPNEYYDKLVSGTGEQGVDDWAQNIGDPEGRRMFYEDSDLKDHLYENGTNQNYSLSVSGGAEKSNYRFSLGYNRDEGFFKINNNISEKYNLKLSYQWDIADWMNFDAKVGVERTELDEPASSWNVINRYEKANPIQPTFAEDGETYLQWGGFINPVQVLDQAGDNFERRNNLRTNFKTTFQLLKGLDFVNQTSFNLSNYNSESSSKTYQGYRWDGTPFTVNNDPNRATFSNSDRVYKNFTNYLNYSASINESHNFSATLGNAFENNKFSNFDAWRLGIVGNKLFHLSLGDPDEQYNNSGAYEWSILSYYGRLSYDYRSKYLFEANLRRDGSSKFHPDKRWGNFGGVQAAWRLSEEPFMQGLGFLDNLKLRLSIGETGNERVANNYNYVQNIDIGGQIPFGAGSVESAASLGSLPAVNATWETVVTQNIGLDFSVFDQRLSGTIDAYNKVNQNMLIAEAFPEILGATAPRVNSGELTINGYELSLEWRDKIGDFGYFVEGVFFDSKNEVTKRGGDEVYSAGVNSARLGYPINSYFGYDYDGVIKTQEQLDEYKELENINPSLDIGDAMFRDVDGNGRIDPYGDEEDEGDLVFLGTTSPRYNFSVNLGANWKNFDLSVYITGTGKRTIPASGFALPYEGQRNRWHKPNAMYHNWGFTEEQVDENGVLITEARDSDNPRITLGQTATWNWRHSQLRAWDGAYARVKNLALGYTLPKNLVNRFKLENVRVYFNGSDLFTAHNVPGGYDPEFPNFGSGEYPLSKNYIFGLQVKF
ncbi:MAG: TonB-dependent receptor [Bacteroidota bacterium]